MGLRDIESSLPPGFRFYPSDEELVCYYLCKKVANETMISHSQSQGTQLVEVDLHTREPWELPEVAKLTANEWYFFSFRDRKYATGSRTNRATKSGYWKATGKDRTINNPATSEPVGMRKTLVFYKGRAPNGVKTCWVMHEFRLETPHSPAKEDWVLCRVFHKKKGDDEHDTTSDSTSHVADSYNAMGDIYNGMVMNEEYDFCEQITSYQLGFPFPTDDHEVGSGSASASASDPFLSMGMAMFQQGNTYSFDTSQVLYNDASMMMGGSSNIINDHGQGFYYDMMISNPESSCYPMWHQG